MYEIFASRAEAGRALAARLDAYAARDDVVVLGLPRGGVPVAFEVAVALHAPLDILTVRKLGVPGQEELALGAIASGGVLVLHRRTMQRLRIPVDVAQRIARREAGELQRRENAFREGRPPVAIHGRTAIAVDDGMATGASMQAAVHGLRRQGAARVIVAVPVAAASAVDLLRRTADAVVCVRVPEPFFGVGQWYEDFHQVSDDEVRDPLRQAGARATPAG